jgi:hypothetical protein
MHPCEADDADMGVCRVCEEKVAVVDEQELDESLEPYSEANDYGLPPYGEPDAATDAGEGR